MRRIAITGAVMAVLLSAGMVPDLPSARAAGRDAIVIGTITDLSGPAAPYGHAVVNAMRMRIDALNAEGGLHGRWLRLVVEDHQFQVPRAVQAANKLINRDRVVAMVGNLGNAQTEAVLPQLRQAGIPNLFPMAASRDLVQGADSISWISGSLYYDQIRTGVKWMVTEKRKQAVCLLAQGTDFGREVQQAVQDQLAVHGQVLKEVVTHRPTDTDFTAQVTRLRAAGCDLVVLATLLRDTILPMATARAMGWKDVDFLGPSTTHDYLLAAAPGGATQGLYSVSSLALPRHETAPAAVAAWMEAYRARFGAEPNAGAIYGAALIDLAVLALDRAGGDFRLPRIAAAVQSIRGWRDAFGGTLQDFSDGSRQGTRQAYIYRLQGPHYARLGEVAGY
ncbi:ABC transporter substrate-binding protein [Ferrovibrio sp.]|uniref:ABC transporter substrate-binding protein n=1 Tax=Ferrovibrio sp. TaxID=1917215 RepID=UPI00311FB986